MEKLEGFIGENPMSIAEDLVFIQGQKAEEQAIIREKNINRSFFKKFFSPSFSLSYAKIFQKKLLGLPGTLECFKSWGAISVSDDFVINSKKCWGG